jgi:hypothetical protein
MPEPEDSLLLSGSVVDLMALYVSYGHLQDVPSEVRDAMAERERCSLAGLPKEAGRTMEDLWIAVIAQAFECARSTLQAKSAFQNLQCASRDGNIYSGGRGAGRVRCGDAALRLDQVGDER